MLSVILIGAILLFVLTIVYKQTGKRGNYPPGPKGLPIIGTLPPASIPFEEYMGNLQHQYGDIYRMKIGSRQVVVISKCSMIKEAFAMPEMANRPDIYTMQMFTDFTNTGVLMSNGPAWVNGRRFAMKHLKDLGMGKSSMQDNIHEEAQAIVKEFEKHVGEPMQVSNDVNVAVLNVIWKMVAGQRYDLTSNYMHSLTANVEDILKIMVGPLSLFNWFPWLEYLPRFIKDKFFEYGLATRKFKEIMAFLKDVIEQHKASHDPSNPRDFIDHYLMEMEAQKHNPNSTFRQDLVDLTITMLDIYEAGSETTSSTIRWLIFYTAKYPKVQEKIHRELDEVVPKDRLPELQDSLPYLDAVIAEANRVVSLVPYAQRMASKDVTLGGYTIEKDTIVFGLLKVCNEDPKLWEKPEEFRPERFLDNDGNFVNRDSLMTFGSGRRQCLGESMARMELKLIFGAVVHHFNIRAPGGVALTAKHDIKDYRSSIMNYARPYKVVMTKRV